MLLLFFFVLNIKQIKNRQSKLKNNYPFFTFSVKNQTQPIIGIPIRTKKMLTDNEIFNRLPLSDEQKAELYRILLLSAGQQKEPQCLADNSDMPAWRGDRPLAEKPVSDECSEESVSSPQQEKSD